MSPEAKTAADVAIAYKDLGVAFLGALALIAATVVGGVLQSRGMRAQWKREREEREREAEAARAEKSEAFAKDAAFSALDLADFLEKYALSCADVVSDNSHNNPYGDTDEPTWTNVPELKAFPDLVDWRSLGIRDTSEVRDFRTQVDLVRVRLNALWRYVSLDEVLDDASEQAALLGKRAWNLGASLRERHGLPQLQSEQLAWDYMATIERLLAERAEARARVRPRRKGNPKASS